MSYASRADLAGLDGAGALDRAGQQRGGRAGVLEARIPGPAGEAGGDEEIVFLLVQAVGEVHGRRRLDG